MISSVRFAACALALLGFGGVSQADPPKLANEEMTAAVKTDEITIPTPGELFAALEKAGKPNWQGQYRQPVPNTFQSRPQIALNLGRLIADGYVAVEAEDAQQVKNLGKDIVTLAKTLGVSENVLRRGKSITDFAENNEWNTLKEELEATQDEVKLAMAEQHDDQLVLLVTLGGWVRGLDVLSNWLADNYTAEGSKLLRQPGIILYLRSKLRTLPDKAKDDPLVKVLKERMEELQSLVSIERNQSPSLENVKKIKEISGQMVTEISTKK